LESKVKSLTEDQDCLKVEKEEESLRMDVLQLESEDIANAKTQLRSKEERRSIN
jgi:hypothetical protein